MILDTETLNSTALESPFDVVHARTDAGEAALDDRVLARVEFGVDPARKPADVRQLPVGLEALDGSRWCEVWRTDRSVRRGAEEGVAFAENGEVLFASLFLDDDQLVQLQRSALRAYALLDRLLNRWGFPHWLRAWHFLARIGEGEGEQERYRRFNAGRHRAIELRGGPSTELPAATAIGTHSRGLTICVLAGKRPIVQVENPRQISAFQYPEMYGRKSPSFSRAALYGAANPILFISGTASIVGHATVHHGDAAEQTREAVRNINALLEHAEGRHFGGRRVFHGLAHKVYVRHPEQWPAIREILFESMQSSQPLIGLHADVCRHDLLVEIEGIYGVKANFAERDASRSG